MTPTRSSVRFDASLGEFTMRCESCAAGGKTGAYWPITREFWDIHASLARCRACNDARRRRQQHATREARLARDRARYRRNRPAILASRREKYWRQKVAA